jgi:TonB family protein
MNDMDANRTTPYELKDELARFCLPAANRDANRKLAWTNSICILFLLIGLVGAKRAPDFAEPPPRAQEIVPTIVEPAPPTPTENQKPKQVEPEKTEAPRVVAVTLDTPAINFSVPTVGNVLVPAAIAQAPTAEAVQTAILKINSTGAGGERPDPREYPPIAREEREQGSVTLLITANEKGIVTSIEIKESSGYPILDSSTVDFVRRHWTLPLANRIRTYEKTVTYKLVSN